MEESNLVLFFGRFHPLIVHLPIGFLLLAGIFEIAERMNWVNGLKKAVTFSLLLGTMSAIGACILGWMLSTSGDYNEEMLDNHLWGGVITTVVAAIIYAVSTGFVTTSFLREKGYYVLLALMVGGLSFTGHMGGNLTHGSDYLTYYMPFKPKVEDPLARPEVTNMAEAQLFGDIVHPILQSKCKSCHNNEKKKGQLSFASIEDYLKGGKHGDLIVPGKPGDSELIKRVTLDHDHEDFMPPEGKTPLTDNEVAILTFWVDNANADFDTLLLATEVPDNIKEASAEYLNLNADGEMIQLTEVQPEKILELESNGFVVRELVSGSGALDVTLPSGKTNKESLKQYLDMLVPVQENIVWLSLENSGLQNNDLSVLNGFKNLRKLKIPKNDIDDEGVKVLNGLQSLESINLYATNITEKSVESLSSLPSLKRVYIWNTKVKPESLPEIKEKYENLKVVAGA